MPRLRGHLPRARSGRNGAAASHSRVPREVLGDQARAGSEDHDARRGVEEAV